MNTIWLLAAIAVTFLAALAAGLLQIARPTRGLPLLRGLTGPRALLVVDVQQAYTDSLRASRSAAYVDQAIDAINRLSAEAVARGDVVLYVRNEFTRPATKLVSRVLFRGLGLPGSAGIGFDRLLRILGPEFVKSVGDAFSDSKLEEYLREQGISEVAIVGLDGIACVQRTARGALNRGCATSILGDGVMTAYPDKWDAMLPHLERLGVNLPSPPESNARAGMSASKE